MNNQHPVFLSFLHFDSSLSRDIVGVQAASLSGTSRTGSTIGCEDVACDAGALTGGRLGARVSDNSRWIPPSKTGLVTLMHDDMMMHDSTMSFPFDGLTWQWPNPAIAQDLAATYWLRHARHGDFPLTGLIASGLGLILTFMD